MIMITSKGQLPGDFGRFDYKKTGKRSVDFFQRKKIFPSDTLEATFNSSTTLTGWRAWWWDGMGISWHIFFFKGEFWRPFSVLKLAQIENPSLKIGTKNASKSRLEGKALEFSGAKLQFRAVKLFVEMVSGWFEALLTELVSIFGIFSTHLQAILAQPPLSYKNTLVFGVWVKITYSTKRTSLEIPWVREWTWWANNCKGNIGGLSKIVHGLCILPVLYNTLWH